MNYELLRDGHNPNQSISGEEKLSQARKFPFSPHFFKHSSFINEKFADFQGLKKYHFSIRERNIAESLYF
jgi:hypothetical protein